MRLAFLGLGQMGQPMAASLLRAGHELTVYNRHRERAEPLATQGACVAGSVAEAVPGAEAVIVMVSDDAAARDIILGPEGALAASRPGQILIDMSTVGPETNRDLACEAAVREVGFLEAPVLGSVQPAIEGMLTILVGGDEAVLQQVLPVFEAMGRQVIHAGPVGAAAILKLCVNSVLGAQIQAVGEAIILAKQAGVDCRLLLDILNGGNLQSPILKAKTPALLADDYPAAFALKHLAKDLGLALGEAVRLRAVTPALAATHETYRAAAGFGLGNQDFAAVVRLLERLSGGTHH